MRTTVTIDPDVQVLLRHAMAEHAASFKQVLNDGLRQGLARSADRQAVPVVQPTWDMGVPLIDLTKATAFASELEDLDIAARLALRR